MMPIRLSYEEFYALLSEVGVAGPLGVDVAYFPQPPQEVEKQKVLNTGLTHLKERAENGERELVQVVSQATAVLHANRQAETEPPQNRWYFSNGEQIVRFHVVSAGVWELEPVADKEAMVAQLEQFCPLEPVPDTLMYRVRVDQDDFLTLQDLASEWREVPALEILEADGMDHLGARELFDSAVEPDWRVIITCLRCSGPAITGEYVVRALQGAEVSWLIQPSDGGKVIAETAQEGQFAEALNAAWNWMVT